MATPETVPIADEIMSDFEDVSSPNSPSLSLEQSTRGSTPHRHHRHLLLRIMIQSLKRVLRQMMYKIRLTIRNFWTMLMNLKNLPIQKTIKIEKKPEKNLLMQKISKAVVLRKIKILKTLRNQRKSKIKTNFSSTTATWYFY